MKDFYQILGVPETAGEDEIKKAYRKLAKKYHPDANPGNKQAESKFKEISEAHEILSNKQKRAQYDQMRKYGPGGFQGFDFNGARRGRPGAQQGFDYDDLSSMFGEQGGFGSFADIFSSIFGGMGQGRGGAGFAQGRRGPAAGDDLYSEIDVPFETAARGGKVTIRLNTTETCQVCGGSGTAPGAQTKVCPECNGRGTITYMQGNFSVSRPCLKCLGRGRIGETCQNCKGSGSVTQPRELAVNIPAGIESGKSIRLKGLGNPGVNGGPPGDLYLRVNIMEHHFFWREGLDIHCRAPINITQAVLGAKIRVRTISGQKVEVKIPPGTSSGARLRLKRLGLKLNGQQGDQIVEIEIKVPEKMTEEEKKMFAEMAEKSGINK